jgi:hypothetical protein
VCGPSCETGNEVCKNDSLSCVAEAHLLLSLVKDEMNLAVIIDPADHTGGIFCYFSSIVSDFEVITEK